MCTLPPEEVVAAKAGDGCILRLSLSQTTRGEGGRGALPQLLQIDFPGRERRRGGEGRSDVTGGMTAYLTRIPYQKLKYFFKKIYMLGSKFPPNTKTSHTYVSERYWFLCREECSRK